MTEEYSWNKYDITFNNISEKIIYEMYDIIIDVIDSTYEDCYI